MTDNADRVESRTVGEQATNRLRGKDADARKRGGIRVARVVQNQGCLRNVSEMPADWAALAGLWIPAFA
jgi:hypothetical protein